MIEDTLLEQSREANRIAADCECWMDELYETDQGPEEDMPEDYDWMDDLDEAA